VEKKGDGAAGAKQAPNEDRIEDSMDSAIFLNALASSQGDSTPGAATPNGVHAPSEETAPAEPLPTEEAREPKRRKSSRREVDDSDPSTGGPRAQA